MSAPVVVVPCSRREAYLDRYAEPDKRRAGLGDHDAGRWAMPYWHLDTAMASLLMLLTATDEGLGACFFGVPGDRHDALRAEFGVPAAYTPIGAITLGHRVPGDGGSRGSAARGRRTDVIHRGGWAGSQGM